MKSFLNYWKIDFEDSVNKGYKIILKENELVYNKIDKSLST